MCSKSNYGVSVLTISVVSRSSGWRTRLAVRRREERDSDRVRHQQEREEDANRRREERETVSAISRSRMTGPNVTTVFTRCLSLSLCWLPTSLSASGLGLFPSMHKPVEKPLPYSTSQGHLSIHHTAALSLLCIGYIIYGLGLLFGRCLLS